MQEEIFRKLINLWKNEIESSELLEIDPETYKEILEALATKKEKIDKLSDPLSKEIALRESKLLDYLFLDFVKTRLTKVIISFFNDKERKNLLPHEIFFHVNLKRLLKKSIRLAFEKGLFATKEIDILTHVEKLPNIPKRRLNTELLLLRKTISDFVASNLHIYRGLEEGDIITIPSEDLVTFSYEEYSLIDSAKEEDR
ncbi:MAG: hypothetical protein ACTSX9_04245 [Candidatus Njordarchaeales archaeon]